MTTQGAATSAAPVKQSTVSRWVSRISRHESPQKAGRLGLKSVTAASKTAPTAQIQIAGGTSEAINIAKMPAPTGQGQILRERASVDFFAASVAIEYTGSMF